MPDVDFRHSVERRRVDNAASSLPEAAGALQQVVALSTRLNVECHECAEAEMFGEIHALFTLQRSVMRSRCYRGKTDAPAPITVEAVLKAATVHGARASGFENSTGTLTPGKQADVIMVRTDGVGVFPLSNAIGTVVQAVERADVDTVMVSGQIRKRAGRLVDIGLDKLRTEVEASRDYLLQVSDQPADLFAAKVAYKG